MQNAHRGIAKLSGRPNRAMAYSMKIPTSLARLKGFRFPREIIAYAVWAYHRFALSTADVEDLLAERGVIVSREAVRLWVNRFGRHFANCIRRDRLRPNDKWHLDEVVSPIRGKIIGCGAQLTRMARFSIYLCKRGEAERHQSGFSKG